MDAARRYLGAFNRASSGCTQPTGVVSKTKSPGVAKMLVSLDDVPSNIDIDAMVLPDKTAWINSYGWWTRGAK